MKMPPGKLRTRQHVIADLSINHVERQALLCGHAIERVAHDYGIDLDLVTFNKRGEMEAGRILLQLKATDRLRLRPGQMTFSFRIERADLVLWLAQPEPVMLIVYDARKTVAYWLYVQSYFRRLKEFSLFTAGKTITVQVPAENVVNPQAIRRFARFRDRILDQIGEVSHDEE